jgi:hypothetical protein
LPSEISALAQLVQHLVVYDVVAQDYYGVVIPPGREAEIHIRPLEGMLHTLRALEDRPLTVARPVHRRLVGRCHHFVLLLVAMLRSKGIPARARCGFGAYFNPPFLEDHWVCEYWRAAERRWALADPQFDPTWRARLGIELVKLRGLWFVAGSLVRDVAALNKIEMLPWDVWGSQPRQDATLDDPQLRYFDGLAALTREPGGSGEELRRRYDEDDGLQVPASVVNALRKRSEPLPAEVRARPA